MRFFSCIDEGSVLISESTERRALLTKFGQLSAPKLIAPERPVKLRVFSLNELQAATGGFGKASLLGKGNHGCLYKGTLKDGRSVAVKRQEYLQDEAAFNNELEILSTMQSHRFVNLVGFSRGFDPQEKLLVLEFMPNGTLHNVLHHSSEPLGWSMRVQIAIHTAKALLALHSASPPVIHRDVKSSSILIDGKWNAKLGDFGLALRGHIEELNQRTMQPPAVTAGYIDPEYETPSRISTKVDVFSFGILLLEIISGRKAIDVLFNPPSILDWALPLIKQGKAHMIYDPRLILLPQYAKALRLIVHIAARCVRRSSARRPSMSYVVAALQEVSKKLPLAKWVGLASVMRKTSGWQSRHAGEDLRVSPDFLDLISSPRSSVDLKAYPVIDRPVHSAPEHSLDLSHGTGSRSSIDLPLRLRLRDHMAQSQEVVQDNLQPATGEEPDNSSRAVMEVSLGVRKRVYNQWRNPIFDLARSSSTTVLSLRSRHRPSLSDGAIPVVLQFEKGRRAISTAEEESAYMPTQVLGMSNNVRSQSVRSSSRQSHIKTRYNFEREEALLPW